MGRLSSAVGRAVAATMLTATLAGITVTRADAQDATPVAEPAVTIEMSDVTPWVGPEGVWTAHFRVDGAPFDADLRWRIHQPIDTDEGAVRDAIQRQLDGESLGRLQTPGSTQPILSSVTADGLVEIRIDVRSTRAADDRVLLPENGSYPVAIEVRSKDGSELASTVVHLNHLAEPVEDPLRVGVLVRADGEDAPFGPDGQAAVTDADVASVQHLGDILATSPNTALSVSINPALVTAMSSSGRVDDAETIDRVRTALTGREVLRRPWAEVNSDAWATVDGALATQATAGGDALASNLAPPTESRIWGPDPTLSTRAVQVLDTADIDRLLVRAEQLEAARAPRGTSGLVRPFAVSTGGSTTATAMSFDDTVQAILADPALPPGLAAHRALTLLFAISASTSASSSASSDAMARAIAVDLGPDIPVATATAFLAPMSDTATPAPLRPATFAEIFDSVAPTTVRTAGKDTPWTRTLVTPTGTPSVSELAALLKQANDRSPGFASMLPVGAQRAAQTTNTLLLSQDRRLARAEATARVARINDEVSAVFAALRTESRSLTVTSRRTTIYLRVQNDTDTAYRARLRLTSPRLRFPQGSDTVVDLDPGLNRLAVPIDVRSSGQFLLRVELLTPDGSLTISTSRQRIRSTTFSGVGLVLSGGALLVLLVWWFRTHRRAKASARADHPTAPHSE